MKDIALMGIYFFFSFYNPNTIVIDFPFIETGEWHDVYFTSYNPEVGQTDDTPCISASMDNVCERSKNEKIIALSQDLVGRLGNKKYVYGDYVQIESDIPQCNGIFIVLDTMNKRYKNRGDLFYMERKDNTSCHARVRKIIL